MKLLKTESKSYSVLTSKEVAHFEVNQEELMELHEALRIVEKFKLQARKSLKIKDEPHFEIVYDFWLRKRQNEVVIGVVQGMIE
jgi:hypothetical protein